MDWISLALISAIFLGLYDIAKKASLTDNAVPVVLLVNVATAAAIWSIPFTLVMCPTVSGLIGVPDQWLDDWNCLKDLSRWDHLLLFLKSLLVGSSWIAAFYALKHLPISIATPIRSTSPIWTILLAVMFMQERPTAHQWIGVTITLIAFLAFSRVGAKEGIEFHRDRWILLIMIATALGAISSLYDKYLLQTMAMSPESVQAWFSIYLVPVMIPLSVHWYLRDRDASPFQWRWTIPVIAIFLLIADYAYFYAITHEQALISVISPIRRSSIVIPFLFGVTRLKEVNWRAKALCIASLIIGVILLSNSST